MPPIINCQKSFIEQLNDINKRLDGRYKDEYRDICIKFGFEHGCCQVQLGSTKVLASVSCQISEPSTALSYVGKLRIDVLSPFNSKEYDKRNTVDAIEVRKILEKTIKESQCLSMETLCLIVEEKVWEIHLSIKILNNDGNVIDCSCIAAITALQHFRLPQVSISGSELTIHPIDQKPPVPLSFNHRPYALTYAFFSGEEPSAVQTSAHKGRPTYLLDPTALEEANCDGKLSLGINLYKEVCCIQSMGESMKINTKLIMKYCNRAFDKVKMMDSIVKEFLMADESRRLATKKKIAQGYTPQTADDNLASVEMEDFLKPELDENESTLARWLMRNFQHIPNHNKDSNTQGDEKLQHHFQQTLNLGVSGEGANCRGGGKLEKSKRKMNGTSALGIIESSQASSHAQIRPPSWIEESADLEVDGDDASGDTTNPRGYANSWNVEIPDLEILEQSRKKKYKKSAEEREIGKTSKLKGMTFRIGKLVDSEIEEDEGSEEEPVLMEMTDFELEQKFHPGMKTKKKKKKEKEEAD